MILVGEEDVVNVVEGQSFNLSCQVTVPATIDSKVTIIWKQNDNVLQADEIR